MFNSKLKKEILQLREDLQSMEQVKSSLDSEMLVLQLDPQGESNRSTATSKKRCSIAAIN